MQKASQNHLLGLLPEPELDLILPHLEPIALTFRQLVYDMNAPIEHAYFAENGVVSLVGVTADGLGVRRATVSQVAARVQEDGLITYSRGNMQVLDRAGIEREACECYGIIRREFERLLGRPSTNPRLFTGIDVPTFSADGLSTVADGTPRSERVTARPGRRRKAT